jgi:hypothetical protein
MDRNKEHDYKFIMKSAEPCFGESILGVEILFKAVDSPVKGQIITGKEMMENLKEAKELFKEIVKGKVWEFDGESFKEVHL